MVNALHAMKVDAHLKTAPSEPLLATTEIQGNSILGFMKPRMGLMGLVFGKDLAKAQTWMSDLIPQVTTVHDVLPSRLQVRAERLDRRVTAGYTEAAAELDDRWLNVGFSHVALEKLLTSTEYPGGTAEAFEDEAFKVGLAGRSALLGDPTDPTSEGHPTNWIVGGPGNELDVLLIFGTDRPEAMTELVEQHRQAARDAGMTVAYEELGGKLDALGHEHFGFQDGVSQPGPRGRLDSDTYLTPRTVAPDTLPEAQLFGQPGQYLVWPGAFVFGYENPGADPAIPAPPTVPGPAWAANGSFVVFRRLRQDVAAFRAFAEEQARHLVDQGMAGMTGPRLQAQLIGRWPSGAPLSRTPVADDLALGADPLANNLFGFADDTARLPLAGDGPTDTFPQAHADPIGMTCPQAAHIRKVNTRDVGSDQGGHRASFQRRLLRRGLPYGPPLPDHGPDPVDGNRGLLFLSYQASLVDQFEFLHHAWMSDPVAPRSPGGHDMVVGQNGQPGQHRTRSCVLLDSEGKGHHVTARQDVVIPTGGGYFFSPSITALRQILAVWPK